MSVRSTSSRSCKKDIDYTQYFSSKSNRRTKSRRKKKDLDVESTDRVEELEVESEAVPAADLEMATVEQLTADEETIHGDVEDFLEEHVVKDIGKRIEDIDSTRKGIEGLRSRYRGKHNQLKAVMGKDPYDEKYGVNYQKMIDAIKVYIADLKARRQMLLDDEDVKDQNWVEAREMKFNFLLAQFDAAEKVLEETFIEDDDEKWISESDDSISRRKNELVEKTKQLDALRGLIKELMDAASEMSKVDGIQKRYEKLISSKSSYVDKVYLEIKKREIEERKAFNKSKLNIQLPKFKGYKGVDIYSFKSDFIRLHFKDVPKESQPDFLKHKYLEGQALSLVRNVRDIDEIWKRLIEAFGDTKIMLSKKVAEIDTEIEGFWKQKDPEKVLDNLNKLSNLMRDLMRLAKEHGIESKLYHGDAMERIHGLMDRERYRRWVSLSCEKESTDEEEQWKELLEFLEKEIKISQREVILWSRKNQPQMSQKKKAVGGDAAHNAGETDANQGNQSTGNQVCSLCGATDHVPTKGPGGKKLVQYFSCPNFAEKSVKDRFQQLMSKNLCFQCLYPGAERKCKHKEGRCQRDFICKHESHERFPTKKHVLVCDDHKNDEANKVTLEEYKNRCILRQGQEDLPDYARGITIFAVDEIAGGTGFEDEDGENRQVRFAPDPAGPDENLNQAYREFISSRQAIPTIGAVEDLNQQADSQLDDLTEFNTAQNRRISTLQQAVHLIPEAGGGSSDQAMATDRPAEDSTHQTNVIVHDDVEDDAVYMLQRIRVDYEEYNMFFDSGCKTFVSKFDAVTRLGKRATLLKPGPISIGGVAGMSMTTPHGKYRIWLPMHGGREEATLSGTCLDVITETFPSYPMKGEIENDIKAAFLQSGGELGDLPELEPFVGGETHFMVGGKYTRYFPELVFKMLSGLSIYRSPFENASGGYGVVGGNHRIISEIDKFHHFQNRQFMSAQLQMYLCGYQVNPDVRLLGFRSTYSDEFNCDTQGPCEEDGRCNQDGEVYRIQCQDCKEVCNVYKHSIQSQIKRFHDSQDAGTEIQYRCVKCRACQECKNCEEDLSAKEEVEQAVIEKSVTFDTENSVVKVSLPLLADPKVKLCPNKDIARKVYNQQLKKIKNNDADKAAIIKSEKKLQDLGYVMYVKDLPKEVQESLAKNPVKNFIPWRVVWKSSSLTTPVRIVFDASMITASGYSLNDILAKGANNLNKLLEIWLRWRMHPFAYHNDINKMYNCLQLVMEDWCLQRYWFEPSLDLGKEALEKVIVTAIYGVISSGNQAQVALRKIAEAFKSLYPEVYEVVRKDYYVDDCMSGEATREEVNVRMDQLELVLNQGGFTLKGFTVSGTDPEPALSSDGESIGVSGHKWFPKGDFIALDIKDVNFAKKSRGRKVAAVLEMPEKLTKRICSSKITEVFDFSGLATPITASWKVDLHQLVILQLHWDDQIPNNLREVWESNFEMISKLKDLRYRRAVIPQDAASLDVQTLEFGDASNVLVCVAIYVRFLRKNGSYSCQLLIGKSRLVPDNMTMPRAELFASVINTHAGEIVRKALYKHVKKSTKYTDSQIALHWITNDARVLKPWVRNRCIEVRRLTDVSAWRYVKSADMIADIGTRPGATINDIDENSVWINGYDWMKKDESQFPDMTVEELKLSKCEMQEVLKEMIPHTDAHTSTETKDRLRERYEFSDYLIDPNRHRFESVVRILAIVMRYIEILRQRVKSRKESESKPKEDVQLDVSESKEEKDLIFIPDEAIREAEMYYFRKATLEIKHFLKESQYSKISKEVNGVLFYTGRILQEDEATIVGRATEVMKDLSSTTFCVPLTDKFSPIAYSLVNEIHWYDPTVLHSGVESTWRYVLKRMFIIEGRSLVTRIGESCQRCRFLRKKALGIIMGPVSKHNLTIAPAFYVCQVDLCGPFLAYPPQNKRGTIKVWFAVFCCMTTCATNIKVMDGYDTTAFVNAFIRFSSHIGYPKHVYADEGGQLIKGCDTMRLDFQDLKFTLHKDVKAQLSVCPVGGHNMHGRVERRIRQIKESLSKALSNERLGVLHWETLGDSIANSINNLPLALRNFKGNFESMDLVTPNRLLIGRNNDRSPTRPLKVCGDYDKIIAENGRIYDAWFEIWLLSHVPKLMDQPKWFQSDRDVMVGDIVLFLKQDSAICSEYRYGIVESVEHSRDGKIRKVQVRYRNHDEKTNRYTYRSARSLVVIHPAEEISVLEELGQIALEVDIERRRLSKEER